MNANIAKGFKYHHVDDGDGDTLVNTGRCYLHTVTVNTLAQTTAGTMRVLDGITDAGTIVAEIYVGTANGSGPVTLIFDVEMDDGIFLDFDAQDLDGYDFTVTYL
jgi:hypothetical protein